MSKAHQIFQKDGVVMCKTCGNDVQTFRTTCEQPLAFSQAYRADLVDHVDNHDFSAFLYKFYTHFSPRSFLNFTSVFCYFSPLYTAPIITKTMYI
jgi:hypothetical protein